MIESMDIAFLLVNIASTDPLFSTIRHMNSSVINPLIKNNYDIRLASIKLRSDDQSLPPVVHSFTSAVAKFEHWFSNDHVPVNRHNQSGSMPICDVLRKASSLDWRTTTVDQCHENVVFLITDGLPCQFLVNPTAMESDDCLCDCDELWTISNQFVKQNLTLVIVGVGQIVSICDSLYGAIAKNTGGEYIPLVNASRVLYRCIESVITQGYTLSQSLRHIKHEEFERNSSYHHSIVQNREQSEMKHCQMMAQKGVWLLDHHYQ